MNDETSQIEETKEEENVSSYVKTDSVWANFLLAALFCNFIYFYYVDFTQSHNFSSFLMMFQVFFVVMFFIFRDYPRKVSYSVQDWSVALAGTWLPMLILPVDGAEIGGVVLLQLIGIVISTLGILSLNKSFGIVPAARRIKTGWMYRFVRHPIYFGYALSFSCMVINNFTMFNLAVLVGIIVADILRILAEEKLLSEDPRYRLYQSQVTWRLIPYVW